MKDRYGIATEEVQEKLPPKLRRTRLHSVPRPLFRFHFLYTKMKAIRGKRSCALQWETPWLKGVKHGPHTQHSVLKVIQP